MSIDTDTDLARTAIGVHSRQLSDQDVAALIWLLEQLGEFKPPPSDPHELARWAGKKEVAHDLKAALYAPLTDLPTQTEDEI
jgi:hypothetical protein